MKKQILFICCAVIAYCLSACNTAPQQVPLKEKNLPKHVILIGFDGLSAHCLNSGADMPTFRKMMAEGASTLENRSILPSSSACNWASMFMGAGPELHGYTEWGSYLVDTLAMSFRKHAPMSAENPNGCTPVAVQYIKEKKPNLCAIIYDQPDGTGHGKGWSSPEYFAMVNHLDSCLTQVMDAVREAGIMDDTVVILTADHGGIETGHGGKTMNEMQTPIVFYGKNVKKGFKIPESTMVYDIAGTIAYLLDVRQPQVWIARPIMSAFDNN